MRINEVVYTDAEPVDGYGAGFFRIGGKVHRGAVLTGPLGTGGWAGPEHGGPGGEALLALAGHVDVLFVGTGPEMEPFPRALRDALEQAGIGVEVTNSPAACRSYNVLLAEGRRVALAVLPI